ncbi:MAG: carboxypeptidase regulatory-like domain-containing protein [Terriglobales bacterium]
MNRKLSTFRFVALHVCALFLFAAAVFAQETTAGLQGTVKDTSGAVVGGAQVVVTGNTLVGEKSTKTDGNGYYRFANLPPGAYAVTVTAEGFATWKNGGLILEVGHLPSVDVALQVGKTSTVVEVSGESTAIDVTTNHTMTNVTEDVINDVPHGRSFQSVIQFAPSARNEPLMGNNLGQSTPGTGGAPPGSGTNGQSYGFSVAGASDAENSYLVEGQETANLIGGYSHTNVPFDFIQEVQIKSSGIEAEHGGALGGVVNVIMRKGTNSYHGSVFSQFENNALDGSPQEYHRYDPSTNVSAPGGPLPNGTGINTTNGFIDAATQLYQPQRYHNSDLFPGFTLGGPIMKDRIFAFVGFNPEWTNQERFVTYPADSGGCIAQGLPACGLPGVPVGGARLPFSRNQQTYYTTARVDAVVTQKVRVFGSWLYQYQRETGNNLPHGDSTTGLFNLDSQNAPSAFTHSVGYTAPNQTLNFGADITLTPHIVATTRYGYYFENYHDFGYPTSGTLYQWETNGTGNTDNTGAALPTVYQQSLGHFNDPYNAFYTKQNRNSAIQFDQDLAFFKSGWRGTHNFKFGYQLNRLKNDISQTYSEPDVQLFVGSAADANYAPATPTGIANCATTSQAPTKCAGLYGYLTVSDFGTGGDVTSFNHGLFAQDSWTIGHGVTINYGVRFDKEYLPASTTAGLTSNPISFSWGDKVAPRVGIAWDVFRDGRLKLFGDYGKFYDIMKLNVAISSFGGQYWNDCTYALDSSALNTIVPAIVNGRYCVGSSPSDNTHGANWAGGATPAGLTFIENQNFRTFPTTCSTCQLTSTGVVPGLKPYHQHESVAGADYQLSKSLALEARYDRRRLDTAIEDSSIYSNGETFVIGNPGLGTESTFNSFYNFLYPPSAGLPQPACSGATCPIQRMIPAARSYDGVEFRLTTMPRAHFAGMVSYTYSKLRGNYTGLTTSDISDGQQGGRSSPNNSRAFDEPYFQYNSFGGSSSGLLPTDRPNTFKGYGYYEVSWLRKFSTNFGVFQYLYSGTPMTSYLDTGANSGGAWAVQAWDRGKWVDASQDPTTGFVTLSAPRTRRTPWYTQTDFSLTQNFKITESKMLSFSADAMNLLNQRSVTAFNTDLTSLDSTGQYITLNQNPPAGQACSFGPPTAQQCFIADGNLFYAAAERPYDVQAQFNNRKATGRSLAVNSAYGKPYYFQLARNIRLGLKFTF